MALARAGLTVALIEKDQFPRHKLCGEFLSGDGVEVLRSLQIDEVVRKEGAVPIRRCLVSSAGAEQFRADLPSQALSISRFRLDHTLLEEARRSGVEAFCGHRVSEIRGSLEEGFATRIDDRLVSSRVVVLACGRSSTLDRKLGLPPAVPSQDPLVAFKAHHDGPCPEETVELHAFSGGYCGVQPVEQRRVNVCWITRASALRSAGGRPEEMVRRAFRENGLLAARVAALTRVTESYLAVSQLDLQPRKAVHGDLLLAGDSAGMIAPMCGDGMSMAMSSGVLAARLVEAYLYGGMSADEMKHRYQRAWRRTFNRRMWIGRFLHAGYERPNISDAAVRLCRRYPAIGNWLIRATRG
jgi:flavin-dependent dehydrogenase